VVGKSGSLLEVMYQDHEEANLILTKDDSAVPEGNFETHISCWRVGMLHSL
jgi:hypothetical protein